MRAVVVLAAQCAVLFCFTVTLVRIAGSLDLPLSGVGAVVTGIALSVPIRAATRLLGMGEER